MNWRVPSVTFECSQFMFGIEGAEPSRIGKFEETQDYWATTRSRVSRFRCLWDWRWRIENLGSSSSVKPTTWTAACWCHEEPRAVGPRTEKYNSAEDERRSTPKVIIIANCIADFAKAKRRQLLALAISLMAFIHITTIDLLWLLCALNNFHVTGVSEKRLIDLTGKYYFFLNLSDQNVCICHLSSGSLLDHLCYSHITKACHVVHAVAVTCTSYLKLSRSWSPKWRSSSDIAHFSFEYLLMCLLMHVFQKKWLETVVVVLRMRRFCSVHVTAGHYFNVL